MLQQQPYWLVEVVRELCATTGLDVWSPWGHLVIGTIIIVIVLVVRASRLGRTVTDLVVALGGLP